ncbi:MAG: twin-arginine translocase TatA/TatE family subunit [Dehalococcoidia bacterium]
MPFHIGPWELGLILAIVLIIFGVGRLPQVGGAVGKAIRAFRQGQSGEEDTADASEETPKGKKTTDEE